MRRQMWTWDGLSLALCQAGTRSLPATCPTPTGPDRRALDGRAGRLDPWPFDPDAGGVCEARRLAPRYATRRRCTRPSARPRWRRRFTLAPQVTSAASARR